MPKDQTNKLQSKGYTASLKPESILHKIALDLMGLLPTKRGRTDNVPTASTLDIFLK